MKELSTMMGGYYGGMGWGGWIAMVLVMLVFWSLVVFAVVAIFRGTRKDESGDPTAHRDPRRILDERFARGEIDADEYHARQSVLRDADTPERRP